MAISGCCEPSSYSKLFNAKQGKRDLKRYRRKGLDKLAASIVEHLSPGAAGVSVLEVGGGVGAVQAELLAAGAASAVNVELSTEYEEAAAELAREAGIEERLERVVGDFVAEADTVTPADLVVMNRVVCCYPAMEALVTAASSKTNQSLAMVFPRDRLLMRMAGRVIGLVLRLRRLRFQFFIHDPETIVATAVRDGMVPVFTKEIPGWRAVVLDRT